MATMRVSIVHKLSQSINPDYPARAIISEDLRSKILTKEVKRSVTHRWMIVIEMLPDKKL